MITLATAVSDTGARTGIVPVVMHDACIDDARWTVDLRTLAGIYADGAAGVNAEAAKNARIGALVHAVDEAQRTLARFHKLATDADLATPHPRKRTAPADTADDDLPSLEKHPVRAPGEKNPGGAAG